MIYADNLPVPTYMPIGYNVSLKIYHDQRDVYLNEYTFVLTMDDREYESDTFFRGDEIIEAARIISALQQKTNTINKT